MNVHNCTEFMDRAIFYRVEPLIESVVAFAERHPSIGITEDNWAKWGRDFPELTRILTKMKGV